MTHRPNAGSEHKKFANSVLVLGVRSDGVPTARVTSLFLKLYRCVASWTAVRNLHTDISIALSQRKVFGGVFRSDSFTTTASDTICSIVTHCL
jgi:hypothetical protein